MPSPLGPGPCHFCNEGGGLGGVLGVTLSIEFTDSRQGLRVDVSGARVMGEEGCREIIV